MSMIKEFTFTLCLASLCAGVILHLFPDAAAKRCMKAVAGLYILSAILTGASGAENFAQNTVQQMVKDASSVIDDIDIQENMLSQEILNETQVQLTEQCNLYLSQLGYEAYIELTLIETQNSLSVEEATVVMQKAITENERVILQEYFSALLEIKTVNFVYAEEKIG